MSINIISFVTSHAHTPFFFALSRYYAYTQSNERILKLDCTMALNLNSCNSALSMRNAGIKRTRCTAKLQNRTHLQMSVNAAFASSLPPA
ncbi:MAG: hypothetical protein LBU32_04520 [Clostridiales bacterium]|nr:hypothetical protein [Clostridiales bacterium]